MVVVVGLDVVVVGLVVVVVGCDVVVADEVVVVGSMVVVVVVVVLLVEGGAVASVVDDRVVVVVRSVSPPLARLPSPNSTSRPAGMKKTGRLQNGLAPSGSVVIAPNLRDNPSGT